MDTQTPFLMVPRRTPDARTRCMRNFSYGKLTAHHPMVLQSSFYLLGKPGGGGQCASDTGDFRRRDKGQQILRIEIVESVRVQ